MNRDKGPVFLCVAVCLWNSISVPDISMIYYNIILQHCTKEYPCTCKSDIKVQSKLFLSQK